MRSNLVPRQFPRRNHANHPSRPGLTLLEVVIALAIFLFSLAALTHLLSLSGERALEGHLRTQASFLCQSKMAEVMAGAEQPNSAGYSAFPDNPDWQWRMECNENTIGGLLNVQIWVKKERPGGTSLEVSLSQMILSPAKRGSTLDTSAASAEVAP